MNALKIRTARSLLSAFFVMAVVAMFCALPLMTASAKTIAQADYAVQLVAEMEAGKLGAIAVATVPKNVELPATVRIMVPKGFHAHWVGEIMGNDATQDTTVDYTEGSSDGGSYLEVTATKSRTVQAEGIIEGGLSYVGDKTVIATSITNPTDKPSALELSLVVPAAGGAPSGNPVATGSQADSSGQKLFTLEPTTIKVNETISISQSFETKGGVSNTQSQNAAVPIAIVVVIVVLIAAVVVLMVRKKRSEDVYYE